MLIFATVRAILTDIEVVLQMVEIGIHSNEVYDSWVEGRYYAAGYHLGNGGLGVGVLMDDMYGKFEEMSGDYDMAKDLSEDSKESTEQSTEDRKSVV